MPETYTDQPMLTEAFDRALLLAADHHRRQLRKGTQVPYVAHLLVTGPAHGTLTFHADGSFTYLHDGSETTSDSFTYKANDGSLDSNVAAVSITVRDSTQSVGVPAPTSPKSGPIETRPMLGFRPTSPQHDAGMRI